MTSPALKKNVVSTNSKASKAAILKFLQDFGEDTSSTPFTTISIDDLRIECTDRQRAYVAAYGVKGGPTNPADDTPEKLHVLYTAYLRTQVELKEKELEQWTTKMEHKEDRDEEYAVHVRTYINAHMDDGAEDDSEFESDDDEASSTDDE